MFSSEATPLTSSNMGDVRFQRFGSSPSIHISPRSRENRGISLCFYVEHLTIGNAAKFKTIGSLTKPAIQTHTNTTHEFSTDMPNGTLIVPCRVAGYAQYHRL